MYQVIKQHTQKIIAPISLITKETKIKMIDTISLIRLAIIILSEKLVDDLKECIFSHIAEKDIN